MTNQCKDKDDKVAKAKDKDSKNDKPQSASCSWCAERERIKQQLLYENANDCIYLRCRCCGECNFNLRIENINLYAVCKCGNKILLKKNNCECG